jgi:hypothetical protein
MFPRFPRRGNFLSIIEEALSRCDQIRAPDPLILRDERRVVRRFHPSIIGEAQPRSLLSSAADLPLTMALCRSRAGTTSLCLRRESKQK